MHSGVFGLYQPDGGQLPGAGGQPGRGPLGHLQRIPSQRGVSLSLLAGFGQAFEPVGTQGFQHQVAGPAIRARLRRGEQ